MEGHAVQASAQGAKRLAEAVLQRDSDTRSRSSSDPVPDKDMERNSIVTSESCKQRIQSVLKELGLTDGNNVVEIRHRLD